MRKAVLSVIIAGLAVGFGGLSGWAAEGAKKAVDDRMHSLNDLVKKEKIMPEALKGVSIETGVPLREVQAMHEHFKDTGAAGLLVACVLADETKRAPEYFLKKHVDGGKDWTQLTIENRVPVEKVLQKLDSLGTHLSGPPVEVRPRR